MLHCMMCAVSLTVRSLQLHSLHLNTWLGVDNTLDCVTSVHTLAIYLGHLTVVV